MTKTYKHTVLGREAEIIDKEEDVYCFVDDDANEHNFYGKELISLGFIEAPTDTEEKGDWISELYKSLGLKHEIYHTEQSFRSKLETYLPKPVEQELVPLDVENMTKEIIQEFSVGIHKIGFHYIKYDIDKIRAILSKYGVHKQEEREDWTDEEIQQWMNNVRGGTEEAIKYGIKTIKGFLTFHGIHKGSFKKRSEMTLHTPTPQATSVDVEEDKIETIVQDLRECMVTKPIGVRGGGIVSMVEIREIVKKHLSSLPIQKKRTREEIGNACNRDIKNDFANTNCDEYRSYVVVSKVMKSFGLLKD